MEDSTHEHRRDASGSTKTTAGSPLCLLRKLALTASGARAGRRSGPASHLLALGVTVMATLTLLSPAEAAPGPDASTASPSAPALTVRVAALDDIGRPPPYPTPLPPTTPPTAPTPVPPTTPPTNPTPTPTPTPVPASRNDVLLGMSTDDYATRVSETGRVESHRVFVPSWNVASLVKKLTEAHDRGVTPYWSIKFNSTWQAAASGADDARFRDLGNALADLDFETYGSFHHEPRESSVKSPQQLVSWSQANVRAMDIVKPLAGPQHKLGTTDNGFPWGVKARASALTDAQLAVYYTPDLLGAADFLGADFYDGKTDSNPGEAAAVKMAKFEAWATRAGFTGPLAVGEWNAVTATDIRAAGDVLTSGRWAIACLFNSAANNRSNLPTDGSLGTPPTWVLRGERLAAFRALLAR